jgi:hypothetical protein
MFLGIRVILGLIIIIVFLFLISQIISDPLQLLIFGFGSEIVGIVTYSVWKVNVITAAGDLSGVLLVLPLIYVVLMIPDQSTSQSVTATTNWLVAYFQGLPASVMGDIGGTLAAVIVSS